MTALARSLRAVWSLSSFADVATLSPKLDFDWKRVTWGRPDSPPSALCSYCSAVIPEDDVPLIVWSEKGYCARFCETCMQTEWGFQGVDRDPD